MKVLFFLKQLGLGGAEKKTLIFSKYLNKMYGVKCAFMTWPTQNGDRVKEYLGDHFVYNTPDDVYKIVDSYKPDIIHTTRSGEYEDVFDVPLKSIIQKIPVVESNVFGHKGGVCSYRLPISTEVKNKLETTKPIDKIPTQVLLNATEEPLLDIGDLRKELGIPRTAFVFGRISRSDNGIFSNLETQAYEKFSRDVGRGNYYYVSLGAPSRFVQQSKSLYNTLVIEPTKDTHRIAKFYNTINVLLHANNMGESLGTKIQEAMSYKKMIITHRAPGSFNAHITDLLPNFFDYIAKNRTDVNKFHECMLDAYMNKDNPWTKEITHEFWKISRAWMPDSIIPQLVEVYNKVLT